MKLTHLQHSIDALEYVFCSERGWLRVQQPIVEQGKEILSVLVPNDKK